MVSVGWASAGMAQAAEALADWLPIQTRASLIHLGSLDSFDITAGGKEAAQRLLAAIEMHDPRPAQDAIRIYQGIIPNENFGGEFTALEWFAECLCASPAEREKLLADPLVAHYYRYLAEHDFARLRAYLTHKYHLTTTPMTDEERRMHRFLEDLLLFGNPRRPRWERSDKLLETVDLRPGQRVADVGCGPGYFSFQFAKRVGPTGRVFSFDNNPLHIRYLNDLMAETKAGNVEPIEVGRAGLQLPSGLDRIFMCSLYHVAYCCFTDAERDQFLMAIRRAIKPDGQFIVVDNGLVEGDKLPYHGPFMAKELIVAQLRHYGFRLVATHQYIPQRYALVFAPADIPPAPAAAAFEPGDRIDLGRGHSLVRWRRDGPTPGYTPGGKQAAKLLHAALADRQPTGLRAARDAFAAISPKERFGDEYTAFVWLCEQLLADEVTRKQSLTEPAVADYFRRLTADDCAMLRRYLFCKYRLDLTPADEEAGKGQGAPAESAGMTNDELIEWGEFIAFNNPHRPQWEQSAKILDLVGLRPGDTVADVGCGPGYYTFRFAQQVGPKGRVFACDTNQAPLDYVGALARQQQWNIETIRSKLNDTCLPKASTDVVFLCSLYHAVYVTSMEPVKDHLIESIRQALKPGGRLIIVDNTVLPDNEVPYYGPGIAPELVVGQLQAYGFRLVRSAQFIRQRYVLIFEPK